MDYGAFLFTLSAFAQVSGTIFAILVGFSMFLLARSEQLHLIAYLALSSSMILSIIACIYSIHNLAISDPSTFRVGTVYVAEGLLIVTLMAVSILAIMILNEIREK